MGKKIDNTNTCFGVGGVLGLFVCFFFFFGYLTSIFTSSHQRCSIKEAVLNNFAIFRGKHLCWILFLIKLQPSGLQFY